MEDRLEWLDIAKGISIILMVIGHSTIPSWLSSFIWAFHMPLFFIASGWTTEWMKHSKKEFLKRKSKKLMLPFVAYSTIVLLIQVSIGMINISDWIRIGWHGYALWFIPVLFVASLFSKCICNLNNHFIVLTFGVMMVIIGSLLCYSGINFPWTMSSVPMATFFILMGSQLRKINIFKAWLTILCCIITILISQKWRLDMASNYILPIIPLTIGAIAGTLMIFSISSYIAKYSSIISSWLAAVGRETFLILAFSQIIIMILRQYTSLNSIVRYICLVGTLFCLKLFKDWINTLLRFKFWG